MCAGSHTVWAAEAEAGQLPEMEFHASGEDRTWVAPSPVPSPASSPGPEAQLGTRDWVLPGTSQKVSGGS